MTEKELTIAKAYIALDDALKEIDDTHDCHASTEDGCDCEVIGFMRLDLAKIKSFILEYENNKK